MIRQYSYQYSYQQVIATIVTMSFLMLQHSSNKAHAFMTPTSQTKTKLSSSIVSSASASASTSASTSTFQLNAQEIPETYPITKKKLIQKAIEIDPALKNSKAGSYSAVGWSNRLGTVLTPASVPGVYTACRPFIWNKIDVGGKMTVIELPSLTSSSGKPDLFIHSPVQLDKSLMDALDKLGNVKHVVSPNYEHVKYAKSWSDAYVDAYMWACPGLMEREPDVRWAGELPFGCRPPSFPSSTNTSTSTSTNTNTNTPVDGMWDWNMIQPLHIDMELNPFTNKPFFNEVLFYHTPSKTLLTTDTYWNYPKSDGVTNSNYESIDTGMESFVTFDWELAPSVDKIPFGSRMWKIGMDKLFKPFYMNLMIQSDKKGEFQSVASFISGGSGSDSACWDVETVIPCHGDVIRGKQFVRKVLKDHFNL